MKNKTSPPQHLVQPPAVLNENKDSLTSDKAL